jgi:hydrogenase nickel incorporation protein HypA/HybF
MHEMSVAMSIVSIADKEAKKARVSRFAAIDLEIGTIAGIEFDALDFVWAAAVQDSVLENAEKRIRKIPAIARCGECEKDYPIKVVYDNCPDCGSFLKNIIQGKELRVKSLETF